MSGRQRQQRPAPSRIRKRPVSFGNPALGTYHGTVYTSEGEDLQHPLVEEAMEVHRLVAMVDVPPEQVPEGILNLARSHRPWILHVRIIIAKGSEGGLLIQHSATESEETKQEFSYNIPMSPNASVAENAASILAAEQGSSSSSASRNNMDDQNSPTTPRKQQPQVTTDTDESNLSESSRSYLILFEMTTEEAAVVLVEDLHRKPYTSLDTTCCCNVFHVVALQGEAGVSLMSPFFAPATKKSTAGLEIVPSQPSEAVGGAIVDTAHSSSSRSRVGSHDSVGSGTGSGAVAATNSSTTSTAAHTEDYNCAVCLEHMKLDGHGGDRPSILTTVCNHSFHMDCLLQWQDSPCPVCRYDHSGLNETLSQCHVCATTEHNYVCLICGVISCGGGPIRPSAATSVSNGNSQHNDLPQCRSSDTIESSPAALSGSHARVHYTETLHAYALDTETQHVFDFAGGGYVHRLLQNKDDGKLVEVSDPQNTSQERTLSPGLSAAQEGEVVHRKLEGFASQYYTLLKSQLEQQRIFYQGRLEEIRRDHYGPACKPRKRSSDWSAALKQEQHQLSQRLGSLQERCSKVQNDVAFLKSMNESLEANKAPLQNQVKQAQQTRAEARAVFDECLPPLQEKVTSLMLQLESEFAKEESKQAARET
jgi:BRCA1-associated protein